jgi:hypothetical protein
MPGFVTTNLLLLLGAVVALVLGILVWIIWDSRRRN